MPANLIQDSNQPALWVNQDWQPGTPGVFAVIIGVSDYENLPSINLQPVCEMNKLAVSALTAVRIFEWLKDEYFLPGCPLAKCWLVLSPTSEESDHPSWKLAGNRVPAATFANCRSALLDWYGDVASEKADSQSRSYFFFSGHGIQLTRENHVLLTSDWHRSAPSDGIRTQNLQIALSASPMRTQLFLVDACRRCPTELLGLDIVGTKILAEDLTTLNYNKHRTAPIMYATSESLAAWQQPSPAKGISVFGQALSDGLRGTHPMELKNGNIVKVVPLLEYVNGHVLKQFGQIGSQLDPQVVAIEGRFTRDPEVTIASIVPLQMCSPTATKPTSAP